MTSGRALPFSVSFAAIAALLSLAACGGAAAPAAAPSSTETLSEPTTVEEAEARIAAANRELGGNASPAEATGRAPSTPATPPPAAPPAPPTATDSEPPSGGADSARSACETPCRALRSMRTAVVALCRMTGDADGRCDSARKTLAASEARTSSCGC